MRRVPFVLIAACALVASPADAKGSSSRKAKIEAEHAKTKDVPWCAPEVTELWDHTCWFDGGTPDDGRRTLVVYLHGAYVTTPGFQHLQQRAMALQAKRHHFTLLLPTAPRTEGGYLWPTSEARQKTEEAAILANIERAKKELERRAGRRFDETFVAGFSSGAYYGSTLALRQAIDVDGFMVFAGGSSWARPSSRGSSGEAPRRAPVFVGVSSRDKQTASHSRAFGATLGALGWPRRVEERSVGHTVDWVLFSHGLGWLRARSPFSATSAR